MFDELGAKVISADAVVHRMFRKNGAVWSAVVNAFGQGILNANGSINRRKLGKIVFSDPAERTRLEEIVHPPVMQYLKKKAEAFRRNGRGVLVMEIPLLFEVEASEIVDKVVVVKAEQETQERRLIERYGITRSEAEARISAQLPLSEKVKHADFVIDSEVKMGSMHDEVGVVWYSLQKLLANTD
jgi:dephospho-CoA kinase